MKEKCNCGICCDVCCCKHNRRGCECSLEKVDITTGDTKSAHFCKSFNPKND